MVITFTIRSTNNQINPKPDIAATTTSPGTKPFIVINSHMKTPKTSTVIIDGAINFKLSRCDLRSLTAINDAANPPPRNANVICPGGGKLEKSVISIGAIVKTSIGKRNIKAIHLKSTQ